MFPSLHVAYYSYLDTMAPLSLASSFALWPLMVLQQKIPLRPKKHFTSKRQYKRDVCKSVNRTCRFTNSVICVSFFFFFNP